MMKLFSAALDLCSMAAAMTLGVVVGVICLCLALGHIAVLKLRYRDK